MTPGQKKGGKTVVLYTVLRKFSKHEAEYAACITWKWAVWGYMIKRAPHYFRPPTYPPLPTYSIIAMGRTKRKNHLKEA